MDRGLRDGGIGSPSGYEFGVDEVSASDESDVWSIDSSTVCCHLFDRFGSGWLFEAARIALASL